MNGYAETIHEAIDNVRRVFQAINENSKRAERDTGLTGPQLWAIKIISESAPIRVCDLAHRMYLHPATVIGILDRLEAQDLVVRVRSKDDRRAVEVALSNRGKYLVIQAPEVAQGLLVAGLEKLPLKTLKNISDGLQKMVEILGAQELPPLLIHSHEVNLPNQKRFGESGKRKEGAK